jgi:natural product precursor
MKFYQKVFQGKVLSKSQLKKVIGGGWTCTATCGSETQTIYCSGPCFQTTNPVVVDDPESPWTTDVVCNGQRTSACPYA